MQKELKTALEVLDLFPSSERFILPFRLDDCEVCERKLKEHHWVDLFPESEYQNGLKKILQVVSHGTFLLRSKPMELSDVEVRDIIRKHDFFDTRINLLSKWFPHQYKKMNIKGDKAIFDEISCLMWQKSGSEFSMWNESAENCAKKLNDKVYAGYRNWRLPTLEEVMSLMEREKNIDGLHIDPKFDNTQTNIWTSDSYEKGSLAWVVYFRSGNFDYNHDHNYSYVRAVRSMRLSNRKWKIIKALRQRYQ